MRRLSSLENIAPRISATARKVIYGSLTVPDLIAKLRKEADDLERNYRAHIESLNQTKLELSND